MADSRTASEVRQLRRVLVVVLVVIAVLGFWWWRSARASDAGNCGRFNAERVAEGLPPRDC